MTLGLRWLPGSLARRFALAAAGLAAVAMLVTSLASWWLIDHQHDQASRELALREKQFRAAAVGGDLRALSLRMSEIASSTILATGLVDSAGRETYLAPFLEGVRQINGVPVQVMFTDFQGKEIATNSGARFTTEQQDWLRHHLEQARAAADIFPSPQGSELVGLEPLTYSRTSSPEGAVLYKVRLNELNVGPLMMLEWGPPQAGDIEAGRSVRVPAPPVFEHLQFRVRGEGAATAGQRMSLPYVHVMLISALLFSAVVLAGLRLARLLTLDLQRLEEFSRGLFGSGLGTARAPEGGTSEVSSLAHSINDMLDRLDEQRSVLLQEREKLTELTHALRSADRKKDEFLAMLGHELRNPLAPISAGAELLRRVSSADPRVIRTSEIIARQAAHMTKIVDDLLDVSRVTRGLIRLDRRELDLAGVVTAGVEQVRPLVEARQQELSVDVPDEPIFVLADSARLVQVVSNLLTNSAKYTGEGGRISVKVEATPTDAFIEVSDNGSGISPELMPEIFDLFTQGSRSADRNQGGLGLGLALVKHLVELHGGSVRAHSDGVAKGASFTVRLPRIAANASAIHAHDDASAVHGFGALRVMVVDDNLDAAQTLAELLTLEGHAVSIAHDGPSALRMAATAQVDVFILDIGLPGMDGRELARRLRGMPETADAMLIALTGYGQALDHQMSAEAGFDDHLIKPVDPRVLHRRLRSARRRPAV